MAVKNFFVPNGFSLTQERDQSLRERIVWLHYFQNGLFERCTEILIVYFQLKMSMAKTLRCMLHCFCKKMQACFHMLFKK